MSEYSDEAAKLEAMAEEIQAFRGALASPAWTDVILPWLTRAKISRANELIQATTAEKPDPIRCVALGNRVATLEWARTAMVQHVQTYDLQQKLLAERVAQEVEEDQYHQQVVDVGRSNPFVAGPNPPEGYTSE